MGSKTWLSRRPVFFLPAIDHPSTSAGVDGGGSETLADDGIVPAGSNGPASGTGDPDDFVLESVPAPPPSSMLIDGVGVAARPDHIGSASSSGASLTGEEGQPPRPPPPPPPSVAGDFNAVRQFTPPAASPSSTREPDDPFWNEVLPNACLSAAVIVAVQGQTTPRENLVLFRAVQPFVASLVLDVAFDTVSGIFFLRAGR